MKYKSLFKMTGLAILLFIINSLFLAITLMISPYLSVSYIISYSAMIFLIYKRFKKDIIKDLKNLKKDFIKSYKSILPVSACLIILVYIINAIIYRFAGVNPGNQIIAEQELKESVILISFYTIILAPIVEEYMFKIPFKNNNKKNKVLNTFIIVTLFTLLHFYPETNPLAYLYLISYFILGISFAYPFYKTNNIIMSIIVHIINNLINVMIILF